MQPAFGGNTTVGLTPGSGVNAAATTDASSNVYWRNTIWDYAAGANGAAVDAGHGLTITGEGTAGTPAGGVVSIQGVGSGTAVPVSAASWPLPTGAATSANQSTEISSLATIATNTGAAIPAGSSIIGKVGIDQTTDGTTNGVRLTNGYPAGATAITASATGTTGATTATLAGTSGKTTYVCWLSIRANATAAATGNATVTGTITGTLNFTQWTAPLASGLGVTEEIFNPCIPASATNTGIAANSAAPGAGGTVSVSAGGYQM